MYGPGVHSVGAAACQYEHEVRKVDLMDSMWSRIERAVELTSPGTPVPTAIASEQTVVATARPTPAPVSKKFPDGGPLDVGEIEKLVRLFTNEERDEAGLKPLIGDRAISRNLRKHGANMVRLGYARKLLGKGPTDRAPAAGYDCCAHHADGSYSYGLSESIARAGRVKEWTSHILFSVAGEW